MLSPEDELKLAELRRRGDEFAAWIGPSLERQRARNRRDLAKVCFLWAMLIGGAVISVWSKGGF